MKTPEEFLNHRFEECNIQKCWIPESKQAVIDAMEDYADAKLEEAATRERDYFAAKAMQGLISNTNYFNPNDKHKMIREDLIFKKAYEMADLILVQRENKY